MVLLQRVHTEVAEWATCMPEKSKKNLFAAVFRQVYVSTKNVNDFEVRCLYVYTETDVT